MSNQFIKKLPSLDNAPNPTGNGGKDPEMYPKDERVGDRKIYDIKADRWNKNFAYYFAVWQADDNGVVARALVPGFKEFPLPINPSNVTVSIPFAINLTATTRGILEEHNGTIFRNISISGTTGVTPGNFRGGGYEGSNSGSSLSAEAGRAAIAIAANTIAGVKTAVDAFQRTLTAATGEYPDLVSGVKDEDQWNFGYAQLHLLLNYFVAYSEFKKKHSNQSTKARLVFVNQKDNTAYVVTPVSFESAKSSEDPHMYTYRIMLRAWDLVVSPGLDSIANRNPFGFEALRNNPNLISRIFNTAREARSVMSAAQNTIKAVASDFENAYNIVGGVLLAVKELGSFTRSIRDFDTLVTKRWTEIARDFKNKTDAINREFTGKAPSSQREQNIQSSMATLDNAAATTHQTSDATNPVGAPVAGYTQEANDATQKKTDIQNPLNTTDSLITHTDFLDTYPLSNFVLSDVEEETVQIKIDKVTSFSIADWDEMRRTMEEVRDAYADSRQLGDADYDEMARRVPTTGISRAATTQDFVIMKSFNDIIATIDAMSATNELIRQSIPDPFIRAQDAVGGSGIVITKANTGFPIPFPYHGTLESLAAVYLGDPDRWIEIALLNQLKPPYIDEDGFTRFFTTSGSGNAFTMSDVTNLFRGQEVFLSSVARREERRLIVDIKEISTANYLVTVDGDNNLSNFTTIQQAKMRAYLPSTVNSMKIIYIPLEDVSDTANMPDTRQIPATEHLSIQEKLMGADIALTPDFDLAINNNGDVNISAGLRNAIQALQLKLAIEPGQLKHHQEYGAGLPIGERQQFTAQDIKKFIEDSISGDPRFSGVSDISVEIEGPVVKLTIRVTVADKGGVIPIQFIL